MTKLGNAEASKPEKVFCFVGIKLFLGFECIQWGVLPASFKILHYVEYK